MTTREQLFGNPKEIARDLVNKFYQPLGYLNCGVSSKLMWNTLKKELLKFLNVLWKIINTNQLDAFIKI